MTAALLAAMIAVESGGDCRAVGDEGRSIGILQITEACVRDVNRIYGTKYKWPHSCFDEFNSRSIAHCYLLHYAGVDATNEVAARIWNGGPTGHKSRKTLRYWKKVKQQLERQ